MKTKFYIMAILFLVLGLFASGCQAGELFGSTLTPTATASLTSTPLPTITASATPTITPTITASATPTIALTPFLAEITQKDVVMLLIPAGRFTMGSDNGERNEIPPHSILLDAFYMDKYEMTNSLYKACVDAGGCSAPSESKSYTRPSYYGNAKFDNYPVIYVNWNQAKAYCVWRGARLPTEAEWEKAARGLNEDIYPWGNDEPDKDSANYGMNVGDTTAVGSYESGKSPFGLYDMAGNAWEWVNDWYDGKYYGYQISQMSNPQGPSTGQVRVFRGGSWDSFDHDLRSALRARVDPTAATFYLGFRCARSP